MFVKFLYLTLDVFSIRLLGVKLRNRPLNIFICCRVLSLEPPQKFDETTNPPDNDLPREGHILYTFGGITSLLFVNNERTQARRFRRWTLPLRRNTKKVADLMATFFS